MIVLVVVRKILGGRSMFRLIKVVLVYHHQNIGMNIDKRRHMIIIFTVSVNHSQV